MPNSGTKCLHGEEKSLWKTIWLVIGNQRLVGNTLYDNSEHFTGVKLFLNTMFEDGSLLVISSFTPKLYMEWQDHFDALKKSWNGRHGNR